MTEPEINLVLSPVHVSSRYDERSSHFLGENFCRLIKHLVETSTSYHSYNWRCIGGNELLMSGPRSNLEANIGHICGIECEGPYRSGQHNRSIACINHYRIHALVNEKY